MTNDTLSPRNVLRKSRYGILIAGLAVSSLNAPAFAQQQSGSLATESRIASAADSFFGNVRAREISSLSYTVRGCIVDLSEEAKRERVVQKGQVVVKLDDLRSQLTLRTAEARVLELEAAIEERNLAMQAALADDRRRIQELNLVTEEFERSNVLMGRGLINESTMDGIERRFMEATFTSERSKETIANADAAIKRAEIALEIGKLEVEVAKINLDSLQLIAPYDGVLVGFDANVGDCVQEGESAARIYVADQKSVDVFFRISRLTVNNSGELSIGAPVKVTRINDQECNGVITRIDTEANLESQFVEATIDIEEACAPNLFINEAVQVEPLQHGN